MKKQIDSCLIMTRLLPVVANKVFRAAKCQSDKLMEKRVEELVSYIDYLCEKTREALLDVYEQAPTERIKRQIDDVNRVLIEHGEMLKLLGLTLRKLP